MRPPERTGDRCWTRSADRARTMLAAALEAEVDAYLAELSGERDENGHP